jgi:uncharacterized protein YegJ (DUF2314 family)
MRFYPCIFAGALLVSGCASQTPSHPLGRTVHRPGSGPEYFEVKEKDAEMDRAVRMARRHLRVFITALEHPAPGQSDFEVKKPFVQGDHVEHIWLSGVRYTGKRFHGRVDNMPQEIKGLKMGTRASVNPDEITDWLFIDNGKLMGGYTVRVLYKDLSPERKKEFEENADFKIEPQ